MNISAVPWSGSLLIHPSDYRLPGTCLTGLLALLLAGCSSLPPDADFSDSNYQQKLQALDTWSLRGRLNVRSSNASETININWAQAADNFEINLSGTLGLGAVRITGDGDGVLIEEAGEAPVQAASLEAMGTEVLGYAFPASELLYWIRGLPAPGSDPQITWNADGLVATLLQRDAHGQRWALQYDRYQDIAGHYLPGRLRLEQSPYRLTFLVNDWEIPVTATQ